MSVIRLQDNTPSAYINESRDFQLICRLYDCIINGVKFDIDSMINITNTSACNENILQLLQTKVGFFSSSIIDNNALRYVIKAFPYLLKYKGCRKAIENTIYLFLKINHINTGIYLNIINKVIVGGVTENKYTIQIGIESSFKDTRILDEIFKYILPTGYKIDYFFYSNISELEQLVHTNEAVVLYAPDNTNAALRTSTLVDTDEDRMLGAIDTTEIISTDAGQETTVTKTVLSE